MALFVISTQTYICIQNFIEKYEHFFWNPTIKSKFSTFSRQKFSLFLFFGLFLFLKHIFAQKSEKKPLYVSYECYFVVYSVTWYAEFKNRNIFWWVGTQTSVRGGLIKKIWLLVVYIKKSTPYHNIISKGRIFKM